MKKNTLCLNHNKFGQYFIAFHNPLLSSFLRTLMKTMPTNIQRIMVFIFDGDSEHAAHTWSKIGLCGGKNPICDCSRSNQLPLTDRIADIAHYVRTYFWVTNKYSETRRKIHWKEKIKKKCCNECSGSGRIRIRLDLWSCFNLKSARTDPGIKFGYLDPAAK